MSVETLGIDIGGVIIDASNDKLDTSFFNIALYEGSALR